MSTLTRRAFFGAVAATFAGPVAGSSPCSRTGFVRLACGRRVAYAEYGNPSGRSVVAYQHGLPSYRREAEILLPALACRPDIRVISFDRPGIGGSDPTASAGYGEWACDLIAGLAALGVTRFGLTGTSAGAPYMLAAAVAYPDRVSAVSVAVPVFSLADHGGGTPEGYGPRLARAAAVAPTATRLALVTVARRVGQNPERAVRHLGPMSPADEVLAADPTRLPFVADLMAGATAQGGRRVVAELEQLTRPWCIRLSAMALRTTIFIGGCDKTWPSAYSEVMAREVAGAVVCTYAGESHYSLPVSRAAAILDAAIG